MDIVSDPFHKESMTLNEFSIFNFTNSFWTACNALNSFFNSSCQRSELPFEPSIPKKQSLRRTTQSSIKRLVYWTPLDLHLLQYKNSMVLHGFLPAHNSKWTWWSNIYHCQSVLCKSLYAPHLLWTLFHTRHFTNYWFVAH